MVSRRLDGKVALVTGAARGIGRATALRLRAEGACVISWDLECPRPFDGDGPPSLEAAVDVTDRGAVARALAEGLKRMRRIDILVNNAGRTPGYVPLEALSADILEATLDVNLRAAVRCTQAVSRVMAAQRSGRILNVSSVLAAYGYPGQTAYVASKSAIEGLTRTWARELGPLGITVNAVRPGYIRTPMNAGNGEALEAAVVARTPLGRLGEADEVAAALAWLASDEAAFVTGIVLPVDGGFTP